MEDISLVQSRIDLIESLAIDTFGSKEKANSWLNEKNWSLGATPLSLIDTESGCAEVSKILNAISYGGVV